jgi:triosephosphate isomerase
MKNNKTIFNSLSTKKKIIIGNWKLNPKTKNEAVNLVKDILSLNKDNSDIDICIIPPQIFITTVFNLLESTNICIGSQNCYYESEGAYTGEVSIESLKDSGVSYVLCGHSERRILFNETDNIINKKIKKVLEAGLTPVLCIGELLQEKELGLVNESCNTQIKIGLNGIKNENIEKIIIAYEPVWAIGTGKVCEPEDAEKVVKQIRETIISMYGSEIGKNIRIIYGGSVNGNNVKNIMSRDIDGCLVGGASINAESFNKILKYNQ